MTPIYLQMSNLTSLQNSSTTTTTLSPGLFDNATTTSANPAILNGTTPSSPVNLTTMSAENTSITTPMPEVSKIFLQTRAADGIAGAFCFAAIIVTVYQVENWLTQSCKKCQMSHVIVSNSARNKII